MSNNKKTGPVKWCVLFGVTILTFVLLGSLIQVESIDARSQTEPYHRFKYIYHNDKYSYNISIILDTITNVKYIEDKTAHGISITRLIGNQGQCE